MFVVVVSALVFDVQIGQLTASLENLKVVQLRDAAGRLRELKRQVRFFFFGRKKVNHMEGVPCGKHLSSRLKRLVFKISFRFECVGKKKRKKTPKDYLYRLGHVSAAVSKEACVEFHVRCVCVFI